MSHTTREKTKLLGRVRRIRGQVEALERALEAEKGCAEVLQQIAAARGAMHRLTPEVIGDHIHSQNAHPELARDSDRSKGADELIDVIRAYIK